MFDRNITILVIIVCVSGCACPKAVTWKSGLEPDAPVAKIHTIKTRLSRAYLIEMPSGMIVVDPGPYRSEKRILKKMKEIGRDDLKFIFITHAHFDHYGCAQALKRLTGAKIVVQSKDVKAMELGETPLGHVKSWGRLSHFMLPTLCHIWPTPLTQADIVFDSDYEFINRGLKVKAIHLPGHTPGSSALIVDQKYLFIGDLILSTTRVRIQRHTADNWNELKESLQKVKDLHPVLIFPGHGRNLRMEEVNRIKK